MVECWIEGCTETENIERCCDSHGKMLCHEHYKRTHFVEVCDCSICKAKAAKKGSDEE